MSVVVFALLAVFLATSMAYAPAVRLFPVIVSVVGIVIVVYRFFVSVRGHKITLPKFSEVFAGSTGGMAWWMTMLLLVLYALAVPFLGMLISSVLWFGAVCYYSGYYRRPGAWRAIAITLVLIFVVLFGSESLLRVNLPVGIFGI
jgi:hypothetical protein